MIPTKWKCECGSICGAKPYFHLINKESSKRMNKPPIDKLPEGYEWRCTTCAHIAPMHKFYIDGFTK